MCNEKEIHNQHDKTYKSFLTDKKDFIEFLKGFLKESWVEDIKEEQVELVNKSFVLKDYTEKEADLIYKVKIEDNEIIFYILLELQSTVDFTMPYRLLEYMLALWKNIFSNKTEKERKSKDFNLPTIIPMLLYNGKNNWTAKMTFREIQKGSDLFGNNILDFSYILFDINRYTDEDLIDVGNMLSAVFLLDKEMDKQAFVERFIKAIQITRNMNQTKWLKYRQWLKKIIIPRLPLDIVDKVEVILDESDEMEVDKMVMNLEVFLDELKEGAIEEGLQEGRKKGIKEGRKEGQIILIKTMLRKNPDVKIISELTGFSIEEVERIKKEIN